MLSAAALRLAAIEVLSPTAANLGAGAFPTLAGRRVFDSRAPEVSDLDEGLAYAPCLSLYSSSSSDDERGTGSDATDRDCESVLEIVGELAVIVSDDGEPFADALAGSDPQARLTLEAMMAQVRSLLEFSQAGHLFRQVCNGVRRIEMETHAVPEYGLRWHRIFMRLTCSVPADRFESGEAGLPEPLAGLAAALPDGSYAKGKLTELAAAFAADPRPPLRHITLAPDAESDPIAVAIEPIPEGE